MRLPAAGLCCSALLFGFFTYATYDLTNQAVLRNWMTTLSIRRYRVGRVVGCR
ncbi:DUF2177 family protein [Bradyrhizobium guangdongense]